MTKAEFVDKLAEKGKITKKLATESIDLVFNTMAEGLTRQHDKRFIWGAIYFRLSVEMAEVRSWLIDHSFLSSWSRSTLSFPTNPPSNT